MKKLSRIISVCALLLTGISATPSPSAAASPDPVLEWIKIMNDTSTAGRYSPVFYLSHSRNGIGLGFRCRQRY